MESGGIRRHPAASGGIRRHPAASGGIRRQNYDLNRSLSHENIKNDFLPS